MIKFKQLFSFIMPDTHQKQIDQIHDRVEVELSITEKKIKKLNAYLRSEEVAKLLVETLKEKDASSS